MCTIKQLMQLFCHHDKCLWKAQSDPWGSSISEIPSPFEGTFSCWSLNLRKHWLLHLGWSSIRCDSLNPPLNSPSIVKGWSAINMRSGMLLLISFLNSQLSVLFFCLGHVWSCCSVQTGSRCLFTSSGQFRSCTWEACWFKLTVQIWPCGPQPGLAFLMTGARLVLEFIKRSQFVVSGAQGRGPFCARSLVER